MIRLSPTDLAGQAGDSFRQIYPPLAEADRQVQNDSVGLKKYFPSLNIIQLFDSVGYT